MRMGSLEPRQMEHTAGRERYALQVRTTLQFDRLDVTRMYLLPVGLMRLECQVGSSGQDYGYFIIIITIIILAFLGGG